MKNSRSVLIAKLKRTFTSCCPDYRKRCYFLHQSWHPWQKKRIINLKTATQKTFFQTFMDFLTNFEFSVMRNVDLYHFLYSYQPAISSRVPVIVPVILNVGAVTPRNKKIWLSLHLSILSINCHLFQISRCRTSTQQPLVKRQNYNLGRSAFHREAEWESTQVQGDHLISIWKRPEPQI